MLMMISFKNCQLAQFDQHEIACLHQYGDFLMIVFLSSDKSLSDHLLETSISDL